MRIRLFVFVVLAWSASAAPSWAQFGPKHPWLVLDVGAHTAPVSHALFTRDGKELITVSKDKTIRFWDVANGHMLRVLRPPIGPGREGELNAAALSGDGKTLAVAGFGFAHGQGNDRKRPSPVYLIDTEAEEVVKVLTGHERALLALAFSRDGKHLASGGIDKVIRVWEVATGKEEAALKGHAGAVTSLAFSPDGTRLLSAGGGDAPEAWVWSVDKRQPVAKLDGHHKGPIRQVAWSLQGKTLATGADGDTFVALWDANNGKHLKNLNYTDRPMACQSVSFTRDGKSVVASGFDAWKTNVVRIDVAGGKEVRYLDGQNWFEDPNVPAGPAAVSSDGGLVAVACDRNHRVHLYDGKGDALRQCGAILPQPSLVAWVNDGNADSRTVVWRSRLLPKDYDPVKPVPGAFFDRAFQLKPGEFRPVLVPQAKETRFQRNQWGVEGHYLEQQGGTRLRLVRDKKPTDVVMESRWGNLMAESVSCVGPNRAVFATTDGTMELYDVSGKAKATHLGYLAGFNGAINSVAPSPDKGRYLLAGGEDNVLHVWDPNRPHKEDATKVHPGRLMSLFVAPPAGKGPKAKLACDWIAWTPEGYYDASAGGERLMGWHLNNGPDKLASFHPASRFRPKFFRPDVVGRLLKEGTLEKALAAAAKEGGPGDKDATVIDVVHVLPPEVYDVKVEPQKGGKATITAKARPVGKDPITALQLLIDERPWTGKTGAEGLATFAKPPYEATWTVALAPGPHQVRVLARTASSLGSSRGMVRELEAEPKEKPKPALYVLAVGIDGYQKVPKLGGAVNDANGVEKALKDYSSPLFSKIEPHAVLDKDATKSGILKGLDWLQERQTAADIAIIFYAGHGALDKGEFYLLPQDADPTDLAKTGLSRTEFKKRMQALPGRILVVLDACHSGAIGLLFDDVSRQLVDEDCGVVVICASRPKEVAHEVGGHGHLTLSVMEALSGKATVSKKDNCVYLHHVQQYVIDRVEELSKDQQHPTTVMPPWLRSYGLSKPK
jgi:WD40 repeat protein